MLLKFIKDWMLIIAMLAGALLYKYIGHLSFLTPCLIFTMLLLTFSRLAPGSVRFNRLHLWLLLIQVVGSVAVYMILLPVDKTLADGAMICVMVSTATSAAVITGMLGGDVGFLTTYTLISSLAVALVAPVVFAVIGADTDIPFRASFLKICVQVGPILILPLLIAWAVQVFAPKVRDVLVRAGQLPFYLWAVALTIVTGQTVNFLLGQENPKYWVEIALAAVAMVICVAQFVLGRYLGRRYNNDAVSAGQGLGQKNTVLAIWMAQTYLNPVSSVAPAAYVLWQNIINSYQLARAGSRKRRSAGI